MEKTTIIIHDKAFMKATGIHGKMNNKPVICIDNGNRYVSVSDAAEAMSVSESSMSLAIKNGWKCQGMRFAFMAHVTEKADTILDELSKAKKQLALQESELAEFRAWKAEREAIRKAEAARQMAIAKADAKVARCERIANNAEEKFKMALDRLHKARRELKDLKGEE